MFVSPDKPSAGKLEKGVRTKRTRSKPLRKSCSWNANAASCVGHVLATSLIKRRCAVCDTLIISHSTDGLSGAGTHTVGHGFVLDAARHPARHFRRLDRFRIDLLERPEQVVGVAKYPATRSVHLRQFHSGDGRGVEQESEGRDSGGAAHQK